MKLPYNFQCFLFFFELYTCGIEKVRKNKGKTSPKGLVEMKSWHIFASLNRSSDKAKRRGG